MWKVTRFIESHDVITEIGSTCGCHDLHTTHVFADLDTYLAYLQSQFSGGHYAQSWKKRRLIYYHFIKHLQVIKNRIKCNGTTTFSRIKNKLKHAPISNMSQTLSHHFHFYEDTMNQQKKMFTCLYQTPLYS